MAPEHPPLVAERSGSGPPVVLLHGQPGSCADWRRVVPLLEPEMTVVVPDRPGYGRTGGPPKGFAGNAAAVVALLDRLEISRAVLTGFSWGGGVCIATAERYPERVAGMILVSSVGPDEPITWDDRLLGAPVVGEALAGVTLGAAGRVLGLHKVQQLIDHRLAGRAREAITVLSSLSGASAWRSFVYEQRALLTELDSLGPDLPSVGVPVLVLNGTSDRIVPPIVGERLVAVLPDATHTVVDGAGHLLLLEHPGTVADSVRRVVRRVTDGRGWAGS